MENNNIIIKGIDSTEEFKVPSDIVNMIYNINQYKVEGKDEYILPIKITSLKLVLSYCQYHNYQNPPEIIYPLQYNDFSKCIDDAKDCEIISKFDIRTLFGFADDCETINCQRLFQLCCAKIAHYFKCTEKEELSKEFGFTSNTLTKSEEDQLFKNNIWLKEMVVNNNN